jgi:hypothetical protein
MIREKETLGGVLGKMNTKKLFKRITAVATGATMLGATVMGAFAGNLNNYPNDFVTDGVFNGLIVLGENAATVDNLASIDIATSMMSTSSSGSTMTVVEGDSWLAKSGSDELEFSESVGPATHGIVDFLDSGDLSSLANGEFTSSQGTFEYEQFLHFDNAQINTTYEEDDDDVTALFVKIKDNVEFARYKLNFLDAAESDIDASESFELDDYEGKAFTMFGKTYDIVKAVTGGANSNKVTLTLMAGSASDTLLEGESKAYMIGGTSYDISLVFTDENLRAKFTVNGETTPLMDEGDTETLSDGTVLGLSQVLYQNYAGGIHHAEFFIGADKLVLEDDNIAVASSTDELQVNDETIDGAEVTITGSMLDNATSTTEDGELEIDTIEINMTSQDDYFVAVGERLSAQSEFDEKGLLFGGWDILFDGLDSSVATDPIKVTDKSGESEYQITFTNINGQVISVPFAYATAAVLRLGDQNDNLSLHPVAVQDEQYFILNDDNDEDSVTHVIQYKGSDDSAKSSPKIKFKILATGESVERPVSFGSTPAATLSLSGTSYNIQNTSVGTSKDWPITITGGSSTNATSTLAGNVSNTNFLVADGGAKIFLMDRDGTNQSGAQSLLFNVSLIDSDRIDDRETVPYLVKGFTVAAASSEVDFTSQIGVSLTSPDDDEDNSYGYSVNGAWIKYTTPSGGGTSADTLAIDWPRVERTATLYVTAPGSSSSTSMASGDLSRVTVVDATKLDSEVASASAQNLIVVGGPCVNSVAAELLGNPANCADGFTPGKARVKLFEHSNGNMAMLVAGYSGADTRLAGRVIAHRWQEMSGEEVEIEGTTYSDATIGAPAPVVAAAPAAAPTTEQ